MERFVNNLVIAMALSVVESWMRLPVQARARLILENLRANKVLSIFDAREVLRLQDEALYCQRLFSYPHGEAFALVGQPIDDSAEV